MSFNANSITNLLSSWHLSSLYHPFAWAFQAFLFLNLEPFVIWLNDKEERRKWKKKVSLHPHFPSGTQPQFCIRYQCSCLGEKVDIAVKAVYESFRVSSKHLLHQCALKECLISHMSKLRQCCGLKYFFHTTIEKVCLETIFLFVEFYSKKPRWFCRFGTQNQYFFHLFISVTLQQQTTTYNGLRRWSWR